MRTASCVMMASTLDESSSKAAFVRAMEVD